MSLKNPVTPQGIDPGTVRLVAQRLNHYATPDPLDEECLLFLVQTQQAKMQWFQDPNQSNVDNLINVTREASRHFRKKIK